MNGNMFFCLVKDTLDAFRSVAASSIHHMETEKDYNPFDADWAMFWVDFIYEHYEGVKLLICCAKICCIPAGGRSTDYKQKGLKRKHERDPA